MSTFHGRFALGQKTSSLQEPGLLGDERSDIAFTRDTANDIEYSVNSGPITVKWVQNTSGTTLSPGMIVSYDLSGTKGDTDVVKCTNAMQPAGIVDPFLTSNVADDERFLMVIKASRIDVLSGAAFLKGANLSCNSASKAVVGSGSCMRALEAATDADELVAVSCDFSSVGLDTANAARVQRFRTAIADVNSGATLLPAVAGYKYRINDIAMISVGGAAGAVTTVDVLGTQGSSSVKLFAGAQANLTQSAVVRAGGTGGTVLADGASFNVCDTNTAITIGKTGSSVTTASHIDVLLTYELIPAAS